MAQNYDQLFKIILAGDASVGKTNIVRRFIKPPNQDNSNIPPTIGVQFGTKIVTLSDSRKIKTQIWDTAGQQQYRSITTAHYRRALGALVVYDITKERTFINVRRWIEAIRQQADPDVVITLVGNKIDLNERRQVSGNEVRKFAKAQGIFYEQTSAKTNQNIESTFMKTIEEINKRLKQKGQTGKHGQGTQDLWRPKNLKQKCQC